MSVWFVVIPILAGLWFLQGVGTYFQMSHYRKVLGGVAGKGGEGYVGVGNAKGRFGKGVILILVSDLEGTVTRALRMRGMTVFARFDEAPNLVGTDIESLKEGNLEEPPYEAATMLAAARAVEQIERIIEEKKKEATAVSREIPA